ncbi:hypothetical protein GJR95_05455 [Spirosoma endbachense]|uniref:Putative auto-transporter adhesin head GIN domain-containing protein n=2 Tax=Spirosoma endbachense TaxID=2666025 RepID=A0A6P1VMJ1_9BACT|nr:hypothetical protein GJR95_05455 [Spirosoma endbachense]
MGLNKTHDMQKHTSLGTLILLLVTLVKGYGQATETRPIQSFNGIKTDGLVQVHLQQGEKESLKLVVKGIGLKDIITSVENNVLTVKTEGDYNGEEINVYVTYRQLKSIAVDGASKLFGKSTIKSKTLAIATSGAGDAFLTVDVDDLQIAMTGAGNLTIGGRAKSEKIVTTGPINGSLNKSGLITAK